MGAQLLGYSELGHGAGPLAGARGIGPRAALAGVQTAAAGELVLTATAIQSVAPCPALEPVPAGPAEQAIVAGAAQQGIVAGIAAEEIVAAGTVDPIVAAEPGDDVSGGGAGEAVGAVGADDRRRDTAAQGIATTTRAGVGAGTPDRVVAVLDDEAGGFVRAGLGCGGQADDKLPIRRYAGDADQGDAGQVDADIGQELPQIPIPVASVQRNAPPVPLNPIFWRSTGPCEEMPTTILPLSLTPVAAAN